MPDRKGKSGKLFEYKLYKENENHISPLRKKMKGIVIIEMFRLKRKETLSLSM